MKLGSTQSRLKVKQAIEEEEDSKKSRTMIIHGHLPDFRGTKVIEVSKLSNARNSAQRYSEVNDD